MTPRRPLETLSVSQAETFDPEQTGGCQRRWYFERVEGRRPPATTAHEDGERGHELFALHLNGEPLPQRSRMLKAVRAAIASGRLPTPGPHLLVERRFDGQPKRDASGAWVPVDVSKTLRFGGVAWDGFVDLRWRDGDTAHVWDHKFSSDIHANAKPSDRLLRTVQMPVYALDSLRLWPDVQSFRLVHHYVSRRGVDSFVRAQTVSVGQVLERSEQVARLVAEMRGIAGVTRQDDVPFSRRACGAYSGCPHQSVCNAFRRNTVALTKEDLELFGMLDGVSVDGPPEKTKPSAAELQAEADAAAKRTDEGGNDGADVMEAQELQRLADEAREADDIPTPEASKPAPQVPPVCPDCATELHAENSSVLQSGARVHVKCPAAPNAGPVSAPAPSGGPKCADCSHPAHTGAQCTAKRGRGRCQCGAAVVQAANGHGAGNGSGVSVTVEASDARGPLTELAPRPQRPQPPAAPTFPESDTGLAAAVERAKRGEDETFRAALDTFAPEAPAVTPGHAVPNGPAFPLPISMPSSITVAVSVAVNVNLGPETMAFLRELVKR